MRKQLIAFALALGLAVASVPAFAGQAQPDDKKQPVKMSEQEMDEVTAGYIALQIFLQHTNITGIGAFSTVGGGPFVVRPGIAAGSVFTGSSQVIRIFLIAF